MKGDVTLNDTVERARRFLRRRNWNLIAYSFYFCIIRRAHQNDLENIPIFFAAALAYLWTQPNVYVTFILYFGFTILRTLHTIVYVLIILPQPTRALLWLGGFLITGYLAIHSALHAFVHLVKWEELPNELAYVLLNDCCFKKTLKKRTCIFLIQHQPVWIPIYELLSRFCLFKKLYFYSCTLPNILYLYSFSCEYFRIFILSWESRIISHGQGWSWKKNC